jgi:hypothetical protein
MPVGGGGKGMDARGRIVPGQPLAGGAQFRKERRLRDAGIVIQAGALTDRSGAGRQGGMTTIIGLVTN